MLLQEFGWVARRGRGQGVDLTEAGPQFSKAEDRAVAAAAAAFASVRRVHASELSVSAPQEAKARGTHLHEEEHPCFGLLWGRCR